MRQKFSFHDIQQAAINNQNTLVGTSGNDIDSEAVYFVLSVVGTSVTIKDGAGNTVIIASNQSFNFPIRLEGGIQASSSGSSSVTYFSIKTIGA